MLICNKCGKEITKKDDYIKLVKNVQFVGWNKIENIGELCINCYKEAIKK